MKKLLPIILLLAFTSCATMQTHSSQNTTQTIELNVDAAKVYQVALQTAMSLDWNITMSDSGVLAFSAKTPQVMNRWSDDVNIFVISKDGSSTLTVKSTLGHTPNTDYIKAYLDRIIERLN